MEQWSDQEIREALLKHSLCSGIPVTASTRPFLLRKLKGVLNPSKPVESEPTSIPNGLADTKSSKRAELVSAASNSQDEGYYGVAAALRTPNGDKDNPGQLSPFYTSKSDALKAIKGIPGARFKKFDSQAQAEEFSQQNIAEESIDVPDSPSLRGQVESPVKTGSCERANNYPSVKTQDLTKFRMMIEKGDVNSCLNCVQKNPRYLITSGDAPEILKPPTRYNALHCAVIAGQLEICKIILWVIQDDNFWTMVYPDDNTDTVRHSRKQHLLDLYLNMQDKGFGDTPLHFACKLGHTEIVALLLSSPLTVTTIKNKDGKTPAQVIGQKMKSSSPEIKAKIEELLREPEMYYVPILRTEDNSTPPRLVQPVTLVELYRIESQVDGPDMPEVTNGLVGPMSPSDAKQLYQEWRSPRRGSSEGRELIRIKRSDSERGMERIGRQLAHRSNVGWIEYWDFLGCSCDLSKPEGLELLELYFEDKAHCDGPSTDHRESPLPSHSLSDVSDVSRKLFEEEEAEVAGVSMEESPVPTDTIASTSNPHTTHTTTTNTIPAGSDPTDAGTLDIDTTDTGATGEGTTGACSVSADTDELSELFSKMVSVQPTDQFISGSAPTKLDYDVYLALCDIRPEASKYPCTAHWLRLLENFSEEEKKSWRTPRKQGGYGVNHTPSSLPVSPLVISSPLLQTYSGSSPLVTSGASHSKSSSLNTTPRQAAVRYWQRQSTTPRGNIVRSPTGNASTTPRRHGRVTANNRFGKLSFTPRIL